MTVRPPALRRSFLHAAGLSLGPVVALGMGRFAYALLLPPMRADLHWSYTEAGAMNTANALGYLAGAVGATVLVTRFRLRPVFLGGMVITALCIVGCAATSAFGLLMVLRAGGGVAGAVTFIAGAALVAHAGAHLAARQATVLLGVYVAGGGTGIVLSGVVLPPLLASTGPGVGWRAGWLLLGLVSLAAIVPAALATAGISDAPQRAADGSGAWPRRRIAATAVAYLLFGVGYVGYTTFVVALLQPRLGPAMIAVFWVVLGLTGASACFFWGPLLGRAKGGRGLALLLALTALGAAVPVVSTHPLAAVASAVLFGGAFLSTVTAVTAVVRHTVPRHAWSPAIGAVTVGFAAGQCAGPVLAGALSDQSGVQAGMALSVALLAVGALIALAQPHYADSGSP